MIVLSGEFVVNAKFREEFLSFAREAMAHTNREAGCSAYYITSDIDDPERFNIFEEFDDDKSLADHVGQPYSDVFMDGLKKLEVKFRIHRYIVTEHNELFNSL